MATEHIGHYFKADALPSPSPVQFLLAPNDCQQSACNLAIATDALGLPSGDHFAMLSRIVVFSFWHK